MSETKEDAKKRIDAEAFTDYSKELQSTRDALKELSVATTVYINCPCWSHRTRVEEAQKKAGNYY